MSLSVPGLSSFSGTAQNNVATSLAVQFDATAPGSNDASCVNPAQGRLTQNSNGTLTIDFGSGRNPCCQHGVVNLRR